jgi:hypothetical protein
VRKQAGSEPEGGRREARARAKPVPRTRRCRSPRPLPPRSSGLRVSTLGLTVPLMRVCWYATPAHGLSGPSTSVFYADLRTRSCSHRRRHSDELDSVGLGKWGERDAVSTSTRGGLRYASSAHAPGQPNRSRSYLVSADWFSEQRISRASGPEIGISFAHAVPPS